MRAPHQFRHLPLVLALQAAFTLSAHATSFTVSAGSTNTSSQSLTSGDTGSVSTGGTLSTSGNTDAIAVGTGTSTLNNAGIISQTGTGSAIDTSAASPNFTLNNQSGGLITAVGDSTIKLDVNGSYTLNNSGTISQTGTGYTIAIDANTPNVVINNAAGGVLTASGAGSSSVVFLDRAAGSFTINNQGTIWQKNSGGGTSSTTSRAIVADKNYSSTGNSIINGSSTNTAATIRADSNDAIRLGTNVTLINYGSIYSTGIVNTSSASDSGQYLNGISTQAYTASDGVAINDSRSNTAVINYGSITGPRHGVDGGSPVSATANTNLTDLATSSLSGTTAQLMTANTLTISAAGSSGVVFDKLLDGTTTSGVQVVNPVIINYAGGTITGNNGSGVGLDGHGVVINYGSITGNYAGAGNVYQHAVNAATVTVNGQTISTSTSSNGDGDGVDIDGVAYIYNAGSIRGTGAGGYDSGGRPNGADGIAAGGGVIINKAGATIYGQSTGILIDDGANGTLTGSTTNTARNTSTTNGTTARIYNEGTITGERKTAIGLVGNYADLLVNYSTGNIVGGTGSLRVDELNSSTAAAAVQMGGGNDILINYGRIEGKNGLAIDMGDGDDTLKLLGGTVIGTIDGGTGDNTLETGGTQVFSSGVIRNFERFLVSNGSTTFNYGLGAVTSVEIAQGASLRVDGSLSTTNALTVNGTFRTTTSNDTRTINAGSFTLGSSGVLEVALGAGASADKVAVTTTATVSDRATISPVAKSYVNNGSSYTIVSAGGTLTATAANINVIDSAMIDYSVSKAGNDLIISAQRTNTIAGIVGSLGGGLGQVLDTLGANNNAANAKLLGALDSLSTQEAVRSAVQQLSPETNRASRQATQSATNAVFSAFENRIDTARGGPLASTNTGIAAGDNNRRAWLQGLGSWGEQDPRAGATGYKIGAYGVAGGFETDLAAREVMGVSLGYTTAYTTGTGEASGDDSKVKAVSVGGYFSRTESDWTLDASVIAGLNNYRSERRVVFTGFDQTAQGKYDGWQVGGRVELGFPFAMTPTLSGRWLAGARATYLSTESYTETGDATIIQKVGSSHANSFQPTLGVELNQAMSDQSRLQLRARYLRELSDNPDVQASFVAGGPSFTSAGVKPNRDVVQLGLGYRWATATGSFITVGYDAELREKSLINQVSARASWAF